MAQMIDTEGEEIPIDCGGMRYFDIGLTSSLNDRSPELAINVPMYFEDENGATYNSAGVLIVDLKDVFNEYLNDFELIDSGKAIPELVKFLRSYADLFESAKNK